MATVTFRSLTVHYEPLGCDSERLGAAHRTGQLGSQALIGGVY